ncbi:Protein translocase subunit SecA [Clarias magur]|uniref:Protein translocase subunit SecA n=1 Tax=Clarias magur TaxID=1594786 RepID=A0A8J4WQ49_CLAMG|nr:Protein translocase subunit SecA [Clarias magur]
MRLLAAATPGPAGVCMAGCPVKEPPTAAPRRLGSREPFPAGRVRRHEHGGEKPGPKRQEGGGSLHLGRNDPQGL